MTGDPKETDRLGRTSMDTNNTISIWTEDIKMNQFLSYSFLLQQHNLSPLFLSFRSTRRRGGARLVRSTGVGGGVRTALIWPAGLKFDICASTHPHVCVCSVSAVVVVVCVHVWILINLTWLCSWQAVIKRFIVPPCPFVAGLRWSFLVGDGKIKIGS